MKKAIASVLFFLGLASLARAGFTLADWRYYKEIGGVPAGLTKVVLDDEVFANSAGSLADLRLVDAGGREVPYKLVSARAQDDSESYRPALVNNSVAPDGLSTVVLDLGERGAIANTAAIKTDSENFQRNVAVFGSDDRQNWNVLKTDAYIYDYTDRKGGIKTQNTTVSFPDSVYRFLKIEISDSDDMPVRIIDVSLNRVSAAAARQSKRNPEYQIFENGPEKRTEAVIDFGFSGLPTNRLDLLTSGANFNRAVTIFASDDAGADSWRLVGQGYVFRYDTPKFSGENSSIAIRETDSRYLKAVIHNLDNAPIKLMDIETFSTDRELVFQAAAGEKYRLFYGNAEAQAPAYDIEKFFQYLGLSETASAGLGSQIENPGFVPAEPPAKPLTERSPYVLPAALIAASIGLLFLVYKFLKDSPAK